MAAIGSGFLHVSALDPLRSPAWRGLAHDGDAARRAAQQQRATQSARVMPSRSTDSSCAVFRAIAARPRPFGLHGRRAAAAGEACAQSREAAPERQSADVVPPGRRLLHLGEPRQVAVSRALREPP